MGVNKAERISVISMCVLLLLFFFCKVTFHFLVTEIVLTLPKSNLHYNEEISQSAWLYNNRFYLLFTSVPVNKTLKLKKLKLSETFPLMAEKLNYAQALSRAFDKWRVRIVNHS